MAPGAAHSAPTHNIEYVGYVRLGAAFSDDGDKQAKFRAPGAGADYRLGNEDETFVRLGLDYEHALESAPEGASISGRVLFVDYVKLGNSQNLDQEGNSLRELSLRFSNFTSPGVSYSIGRTEYQRKDVHMLDYWRLNTAQGAHVAATAEGFQVGPGKLNLVFLRYEDKISNANIGGNTVTDTIHSTALDIR